MVVGFDSILVTSSTGATTTASTFFPGVSGDFLGGSISVEASGTFPIRAAGTLKNLLVIIKSNTYTVVSTVTSRKNSVAGNLSVSIGASTSGTFEDTTHSDSCIAGDKINYQFAFGGGGSITPTIISTTFTPTGSNTVCFPYNTGNQTMTGSASNYYHGLSGYLGSITQTESNALSRVRIACTISNLYTYFVTDTGGFSESLGSDKNSVAGALTISKSFSSTGAFEDTTNSDSLVVGNDYDLFWNNGDTTNGAAGYNYTYSRLGVMLATTSTNDFLFSGTDPNAVAGTISFGTTVYLPIAGFLPHSTTESDFQIKKRISSSLLLKELTIHIIANSVNASSTFNTRKNGAAGNMSVSIAASTTGVFNDSTHTDSITNATDLFNYSLTTSGGTAGTISVGYASCWGEKLPPVLNNRSISETAITASAATTVLKIIRKIAESAVTVSQTTIIRKVVRSIVNEPSKSISNTLALKVVRAITNSVTVSNDIASVMRKYFRTITASSTAITVSQTLVPKPIRPINEPAKSISDSTKLKSVRAINEPAKTITGTLALKVTRSIIVPIIFVSQTLSRKAGKTITESAITISNTVSFKVIRAIANSITVSQTLSRFYKATRNNIADSVSVNPGSVLVKTTRPMSEPAKSISDTTIQAHKIYPRSLTETTITITQTLALKVKRIITESATTAAPAAILSRIYKAIRPSITESVSATAAATTKLKIIRPIAVEPPKSITNTLSDSHKAVRFISETITTPTDILSRQAFHKVSLTEVNNILDNITSIHRVKRVTTTEPSTIQVAPSTVTRRALFVRNISENPPIEPKDIINKTKIKSGEEHIFKMGMKFTKHKITDDTQYGFRNIDQDDTLI